MTTAVTRRVPSDESQRLARAAAVVAGLTWGSQLKSDTAYAVARWCQSRDIDPITELEVLGGKPLPNARWWLRKIGEIGEAVEYVREDLIHADPRLEALALAGDEWATSESIRRQRERIRYGAPEEAAATCVVRIKLRSMADEVSGVQFAGGGTGRKIGSGGAIRKGQDADPIGETFPVESATTRAYGKAARVLAGFFPKLGAAFKAAEDDEGLAHQVAEETRAASEVVVGVRSVQQPTDPYATPSAPSPPSPPDAVMTPEESLALDREIDSRS